MEGLGAEAVGRVLTKREEERSSGDEEGEEFVVLIFFQMLSVGETASEAFRFPGFRGGGGSSSSESMVKSMMSADGIRETVGGA